MYCSSWKITWKTPNTCNDLLEGPHSHILLTEGSEEFFWVWNFGQKGFFWSMKDAVILFWGHEKNTGIFWGIVLFSSSNQQWCTKCNLLLVWNFFGYAKNIGIFWSMQILKLGLLFYGGIKYEPLSDSPIIRISEWGPWELTTCTCNHV